MNENLNENLNETTEKVVSASTKLNGKDKLKIGGIVTGIAAAGYAVGTYVIKPGVKWLVKKFAKKKVEDAPVKKSKKAKDNEPEEVETNEEETEE